MILTIEKVNMVVWWDLFVGSDQRENHKTIYCDILVMNNQLFKMIKQWMVVALARHVVFNTAWNKKVCQNRESLDEKYKVQSDVFMSDNDENNNILHNKDFDAVYKLTYLLSCTYLNTL